MKIIFDLQCYSGKNLKDRISLEFSW